jgi:hypothetical protein
MVRAPAFHTVSDIGELGSYSHGRSVQHSSIWPVLLRDGVLDLVLRRTMPEQDDVVARSKHTNELNPGSPGVVPAAHATP